MLPGWKTGYFSFAHCQLEYTFQHHPGKPWMVFLHGFGQNFRAFDSIYEKEEGQYSFLAFHIFFHGDSQIEEDHLLSMGDWAFMVSEVFKKLEIEKAHWLGFSMGAKFTLSAFQFQPDLFERITLLAPDGLVMNPWYRFATQTFIGRFFLIILLQYLPAIRFLVLLLSKTGFLAKSLGRFVESQLNSPSKRKQVLNTWLKFRKIWPEASIWHPFMTEREIPVLVVLGQRDTVIPKSKFNRFRKNFPGIQWQEIPAGHGSLVEKWAASFWV